MIRLLKSILVFTVAFIAIAGILPEDSYADYGAYIESANCDPSADPALDYLKTETDPNASNIYPTKSCIGQNIGVNEFKVKVIFDKDDPEFAEFVAKYVGANLPLLIIAKAPVYWGAYWVAYTASMSTCSVGAVAASLCVFPAIAAGESAGKAALIANLLAEISVLVGELATGGADSYINIGHTKDAMDWVLGPIVRIMVNIEGDKAAVDLLALPTPFTFEADRSSGFNSKYAINDDSPLAENSFYIPATKIVPKPPVPAFISQSCVDYDVSASQFRWPPSVSGAGGSAVQGKSRSFIGVVVQCIEDTMTNLFFNKHNGATESVFVKTQNQLKSMIQAMLALYVVLLGYKYVIGERSGTKRNDFIWMGLKVALVLYFAAGPGMTYLLPGIISSIKNFSAIIIEAGSGTTSDKAQVNRDLNSAKADYEAKRAAYSTARIRWAQYTSTVTGYTEAEKQNKKNTMDQAKADMDAANETYENARLASLSFGYDYCNFKPFADAGKYNYTSMEEGVSVTRDMSYMRVWDAIDCRLSKYLGVGADVNYPSTPKVLLIGIGSIFGSILGLIIFVLSITFIIFVVLITVRIVHIYIIAFIAIILLVYISPLAIPMVLFNYTKSSFDAWLKQLIAFSVQPIILFAFLALMFSIFDSVMYGSNYDFLPVNKSEIVTAPQVSDHTIAKVHNSDSTLCTDQSASDCVYADTDALGYLYQKAGIVIKDITIQGATVFSIFKLKNLSDSAVVSLSNLTDVWTKDDPANLKVVDWSDGDYLKMLTGLMKATFMCFILYALLGQAETMSEKLTNIAGGATSMSAAPKADPTAIANAAAIPALQKAGGAAMAAGGFAMKQTAGRVAKNIRRAGIKRDNG